MYVSIERIAFRSAILIWDLTFPVRVLPGTSTRCNHMASGASEAKRIAFTALARCGCDNIYEYKI